MPPSAERAITILSKLLDQVGPGGVAYWVTPNTVLTLSGARAYCDGVFYAPDDDQAILRQFVAEMQIAVDIFQVVTDGCVATAKLSTTNAGDPYALYELMLQNGLDYALRQTHLLPASSALEIRDLPEDTLIEALIEKLSGQPAMAGYNDEILRDAATGIMLGYPDKAIIGGAGKWDVPEDPFAESLIDADIRGSNYYSCPQPVYMYPRHLVTDPDITAHEALWTGILRDFYTSDFHAKLAKEPAFHEQALRIGLIYD